MSKFVVTGRRCIRALLGMALVAALTACGGGGGNAGTPVIGPGSGAASAPTGAASAPAADLALTVSPATIPNDGSQTATVTVTSLDSNSNVTGGAPVTVTLTDSVKSNGAFVNVGGKTATDATSGQLQATVSLGSDHTNRTISVNATSGSVTRTVTFSVVNPSGAAAAAVASDLTLALDKTNVSNAGGSSGNGVVNVTVTAVDANRNVIAGIPVVLSVNNNATIAVSSSNTSASGTVTGVVNIGADKSNRLITVTATSGTLVRTGVFQVTGAQLQGTSVPSLVTAGQSQTADSTPYQVQYTLSDVNKNPMIGVPIAVSGPGIDPSPSSAVTDSNGNYVFKYTAPTAPGSLSITAIAGGATSTQTVTVSSGTSSIPPATGTVNATQLSASPTVVNVNATSTTSNLSQIRALFLDANNAAIPNIRVYFDLNGAVNTLGASLTSGSTLVYTDASGTAVTNYVPGATASPINGVTIRACWDYQDFTPGSQCPNQITTTLTVVSQPLSITIGTDNTISQGSSGLTYVKKFVLLVVDSAGNPKANVQITPSLTLTDYIKGYYTQPGSKWVPAYSETTNLGAVTERIVASGFQPPICPNEDKNGNGVIDTGDDFNNNGQLDPRKSDASISMVGSTVTDGNGVAVLQIEYPQNVASWVAFQISASAAGVVSPPATYSGVLPVDAAAITATAPPPFVVSPYGTHSYANKSGTGINGCGVPPYTTVSPTPSADL